VLIGRTAFDAQDPSDARATTFGVLTVALPCLTLRVVRVTASSIVVVVRLILQAARLFPLLKDRGAE
jgi:hypothetical protein